MAIYTGTAGLDNFVARAGEVNTFRFTSATLQADDIVTGNTDALADTLQLIGSIGINLASFPLITGIERILMPGVAGTVILTQAFGALAYDRRVEVAGNLASDRVEADTFDKTMRLIFTTGSNSSDDVRGGAGADEVTVNGAGSLTASLGAGNDIVRSAIVNLDATDFIDGGSGIDTLVLVTAGALTAGQLAGLLSIETIQFHTSGATTIQVDSALVQQAGGTLRIIGNGADGGVDASSVGAGLSVVYEAGAGVETVLGGAGDDTVIASGSVSGDLGAGDDTLRLLTRLGPLSTIAGGDGFDRIEFAVGGVLDLSNLSGYEEIEVEAASTVTLGRDAGLRLFGSDGIDRITLGGVGQSVYGQGGDDIVTAALNLLPGAVLRGGSQVERDTLILTGAGSANLAGGTLVTGFERIEIVDNANPRGFRDITFGSQAADIILRAAATVKLGTASFQSLIGSRFADDVTFGVGGGQVIDAGGGNDIVRASAAVLASGAQASGGLGDDTLVITGGGTVDLLNTAILNFEQITLAAATNISTSGLGPNPRIVGSTGADTILLRGAGGVAFGGLGNDTFRITAETAPAWALGSKTIDGGLNASADAIEVEAGNGSYIVDFTQHKIQNIDQILVRSANATAGNNVNLIISNGMVQTAEGLLGAPGELKIDTVGGTVAQNVIIDASDLLGSNAIRFGGSRLFAGNDTINTGTGNDIVDTGAGNNTVNTGAGDDTIFGGNGNDTISGGSGDDTLFGGAGNDVLNAGDGVDRVVGGFGGDVINLTDDDVRDFVSFESDIDGSADINTSQPIASADRVNGFEAGVDKIGLSRPGMNLGAGAVLKVAGNAAWDVVANSVFIFDGLDTLPSAGPIAGTLAELVGAMADVGPVTGSTAGRTVVLLLSNNESAAVRQTGMWLWKDTDGDGVIEAADTVNLLAVFNNLSTAQLQVGDFVL